MHLILSLRANRSVSDWLRLIKGSSSRWLNEQHPRQGFGWQAGYGAFSVSGNRLEAVRRYVRRQKERHEHCSLADEIVVLCRAARIDPPGDPRAASEGRGHRHHADPAGETPNPTSATT